MTWSASTGECWSEYSELVRAPGTTSGVGHEHQRPVIEQSATLLSSLADISLPEMARRTSSSAILYSEVQTSGPVRRASEALVAKEMEDSVSITQSNQAMKPQLNPA